MYGHGWQAQKPVMDKGAKMKWSFFDTLPDDIKQELNNRIIAGRHMEKELVEWLAKQDCKTSKSAMNRYCVNLRGRLAGSSPLVGLLPSTVSKHHQDIGALGRLLTQKLFIDAEIDRLKQVIFDTQASQGVTQ
jgi:hypothetical protein